MQIRKNPLVNDCYYHIFSRSIAKFVVFNDDREFSRLRELLKIYNFTDFSYKYSRFSELEMEKKASIIHDLERFSPKYVEIVAYCLMPTHIHLVLKQLRDNGISQYMSKVLNSYSRFFNISHRRTGPLWSGRFKSVIVTNDSQLLHLSRYLHLNPTSAGLVNRPEDWIHSSYSEYLGEESYPICSFEDVVDMTPRQYANFVLDRKDYQKQISKIKSLLIDDYTG